LNTIGDAAIERVDCTVCGSSDHREVACHGEWGVRRCNRCSMIFVSPRPTAEAMSALYDLHYFDGTGDYGNQADEGGMLANASGYLARTHFIVRRAS